MTEPVSALDDLTFRSARIDDAAQLAEIHLQTWQATYRGLLSARYLEGLGAGVARRSLALGEAIAQGSFSVWVAERERHLIGWASFGSSRDAHASPTTGELRAINLLPQVWSLGIGRRLWEHVRQQLIGAGYTDATVWVIQGNQRALGFYEALGFTAEPDTAMTVVDNDEPLPLIRYRVRF